MEQQHIVAAFTFELSKCEVPQIRTRMLGNLRNVDEALAQREYEVNHSREDFIRLIGKNYL